MVIPASIAWAAATRAGAEGGTRQGFLGVSSLAVAIPEKQRGGRAQSYGLLISNVAGNSPADTASRIAHGTDRLTAVGAARSDDTQRAGPAGAAA